jgi:hypothetical protein
MEISILFDMQNGELHFKSKFTDDGLRYRLLRQKEAKRFEYLGLERDPSATWFFRAYVYTPEQAMEKGIEFRGNWQEAKNETEKEFFGKHVFCQKDDWLITEHPTPDGEFWVMQCLWRNENPNFPHIRTPTGTYSWLRKVKDFDGMDLEIQYRMGKRKPYEESGFEHGNLSAKQKLLVTFIIEIILQVGYYNKNVVKFAYQKAHGWSPTWIMVSRIMQSHKIMSKVAEGIAEKLKDKHMDLDFVLDQLKEMATSDYKEDPKRRERVVRLLGAMSGADMYEVQYVNVNDSPIRVDAIDAETASDLKMLEE